MGPDDVPLWLAIARAVPVGLAFGWFAVSSVVLTRIDRRTHRLPDAIVLPGYVVAVACFLTAALVGGPWHRVPSSLVGMAGMLVFYGLLRAISRRGLGGGDVKLAGLVGLHLGWLGYPALVGGAVLAFLLGGVYAVVLLARRRATGATRIPFGPFMLAGAWIPIALALSGTAAG